MRIEISDGNAEGKSLVLSMESGASVVDVTLTTKETGYETIILDKSEFRAWLKILMLLSEVLGGDGQTS